MADTVVVFDFDETIVHYESDKWMIDELGAVGLFDRLLPTMPWNSMMDKIMSELHSQGKTIEEIAGCLKRTPLVAHMISAIKSAHALGCEIRMVSDANIFSIETVLKHHGVLECFSEITTNPSYVDEEGKLRIFPYHDFTTSSHGCTLCPPNMCKSKIMEGIRASALAEGKKRFIYIGDGKGDYCPALRLSEADCIMPRKNYPLWELIRSNADLLNARVCEWSDGEEVEKILWHLIKPSVSLGLSNSAELAPREAYSATMAVSAALSPPSA